MNFYITLFGLLIVSTYFLVFGFILFSKKYNFFLINDDFKRKKIVSSAGIIFFMPLMLIFLIYYQIIEFDKLKIIIEIFDNEMPRPMVFFISILMIGVLGLSDDIKSIDYRIRLFFQFSIIFISLSLFQITFFPEIPLKVKQYIIIIFWVYLINVHNFIDGLDGFLLINFIQILTILIIKFYFDNSLYPSTIISFIFLPVSLVILYFNFPKAKVFLGDAGSYMIGFLVGYIFFELINNKFYYFAYVIILYPLIDVTLTIMIKVCKGKKPWDRLFDYFFLKPTIEHNYSHLHSTFPLIIFSFINLASIALYYKLNLSVLLVGFVNLLNSLALISYYGFFNFFKKKIK